MFVLERFIKKEQVSKLEQVTTRAEYPYEIAMVTTVSAKIPYYSDYTLAT